MRTLLYFTLGFFLAGACTAASGAPVNIKDTVQKVAAKYNIDPNVVLAIIEIESSFNPKATGSIGEIGLMQLHPKYFPNAKYEIEANIEVGVQHLLYWKKRCPTKKNKTYVNCYNRGYRPVVNPKTTPYYRKFIRAYHKHSAPPLVASVDQ
jgi:hypothetical protein